MTETPERPTEPTTEPSTEPTAEATTEPTATATTEPTTEPTTTATTEPTAEGQPRAAEAPPRWYQPSRPNRLNRVAALVAIVAGAVVVVAGIFTTGVVVGAESGGHHATFERAGRGSAALDSDHGMHSMGQVWLVPRGAPGEPGGFGGTGGVTVQPSQSTAPAVVGSPGR